LEISEVAFADQGSDLAMAALVVQMALVVLVMQAGRGCLE
jgi:hypothetical protein